MVAGQDSARTQRLQYRQTLGRTLGEGHRDGIVDFGRRARLVFEPCPVEQGYLGPISGVCVRGLAV